MDYIVNVDYIDKLNAVAIIPTELWEEYKKNKEEIYSLTANEWMENSFIKKYNSFLSGFSENWQYKYFNCSIRVYNEENKNYEEGKAQIFIIPYLKQIFLVWEGNSSTFREKLNYFSGSRFNRKELLDSLDNLWRDFSFFWGGFRSTWDERVFYNYEDFNK